MGASGPMGCVPGACRKTLVEAPLPEKARVAYESHPSRLGHCYVGPPSNCDSSLQPPSVVGGQVAWLRTQPNTKCLVRAWNQGGQSRSRLAHIRASGESFPQTPCDRRYRLLHRVQHGERQHGFCALACSLQGPTEPDC